MPVDRQDEYAVDRFVEAVAPDTALVATDFDGTLARIVPTPGEARALPGALETLTALVELTCAVAIISGRSEKDLHRLVPVSGVRLLGDYGRPAPGPDDRAALERFNVEAAAAARSFAGVRVEAKAGSSSVHFRANPAAGEQLLTALAPLAAAHGLEARRGRLVLEIVPAGWDKARALQALIDELRPRAAVFAGDDTGDRGCFTYLSTFEGPHLVIGVSSPEAPPDLFEACDLVLDGPEANLSVLRRLAMGWARRARGRAGHGPGG